MKLAYLVYPMTKIRPTCIFAITMYCLIFTLTLNGSPVIFYGYVYKLPGMPNIRKDDGTSSSVSNYYLFSMWLKYHPNNSTSHLSSDWNHVISNIRR